MCFFLNINRETSLIKIACQFYSYASHLLGSSWVELWIGTIPWRRERLPTLFWPQRILWTTQSLVSKRVRKGLIKWHFTLTFVFIIFPNLCVEIPCPVWWYQDGGPWEVINSRGWSSCEWDSWPWKEILKSCSISHTKNWRSPSLSHSGILISDFQPPSLQEISAVYKPPVCPNELRHHL